MDKIIVIVRGIPGSGKSTFVRKVLNQVPAVICAADDYRYNEKGEYVYKPEENKEKHALCMYKFEKALEAGRTYIIVDNTNLQSWEYKDYIRKGEEHGYMVFTVAMKMPKALEAENRNIHGVPLDVIENMIERFKP